MSPSVRERWERAIRIAYRALQRKERDASKSPSHKPVKEEERDERYHLLPREQ